jgi:diguanylate cyclase (GGDEF)-like protein
VLRFALSTVIGLALAAAAILLVVRHYDTVQAERNATAQARVLASTVLRGAVGADDFEGPVAGSRRAALDRLFSAELLRAGFIRATLLTEDGRVSYSTDHRLIDTRAGDRAHIREALGGTIRGDVTTVRHGDASLKALRTYAPVAVRGGSGVVVLYQDYGPIAKEANGTFLPVAGIFEVVLLLLFAALVPILRRVTLRIRRQMEEIEHRAHYDELTGLPNRTLFRICLQEDVAAARESGGTAVVLVLDVDRFKEVNDALGHECGDVLLEELGARLHSLCGHNTVARLGGDEFAILLPAASADDAVQLAGRVHIELERPFDLRGFSLEIAASVGVAAYPEHGGDVDALLQHADVAMYVAKAAHAGTAVYDPEQDTNDAARLALAGELRRAIESAELVVHFQPKAELESGRISGVEALVRWQHPTRGFIPPDEFIPIAERTGLIKPLSGYVLRAAVGQCARWAADGIHLHVAVNLTIPDLLDLELPDVIAALLEEHGLDPAQLELEITESTILADPARVRHNLDRLHELGVRLAIDDFGTGYSSLGYLKQLPVHTIKIDRSFVMDMLDSPSDAAIVRATIELAGNLGLSVVAEGVETQAMWDALREQGCTLAQGYLISKPASAEDLAPLLADRARPPQQPGRAGLRASKAPAALRAKSSTGRRPRSHSSLPTR